MSRRTYKEALDYLFYEIPNYHRVGKAAIKLNLDNIKALCDKIGNPQHHFQTIHVAGSNGKGSVCHVISALLQQHDLRVGLYTSPHYKDFRERIKINNESCPRSFVIDFLEKYQEFIDDLRPSFFEVTVAMSFQYFKEQGIRWAVIETGLGGRLDSTNILSSQIQVITSISLEHTQTLGDTIEKIAAEKAGIIKYNSPVVVADQVPAAAKDVIAHKAAQLGARISIASDLVNIQRYEMRRYSADYALEMKGIQIDGTSDLQGPFQKYNMQTALAAYIKWLEITDRSLDATRVQDGLKAVRKTSALIGRWQWLQEAPGILIDGAHNLEALEHVLQHLQQEERAFLFIGFSEDKEITSFIDSIPDDIRIIVGQAHITRALPAADLARYCRDSGKNVVFSSESLPACIDFIREHLTAQDTILITGSIYLVGQFLEHYEPFGK